MKIGAIVSFAIGVSVFTYLVGATLGSPVGQVLNDDLTTVLPDILNDDAATTPLADEVVTGEPLSATQRARQDDEEEEDDDDDAVTDAPAAPVVSTSAPVPPPRRNESSVLSEFNYVSQQSIVNPPVVPAAIVAAQPLNNRPVDEEDEEADQPTEAPNSQQKSVVQESEDKDSDNEITQDEPATTGKPTTFVEEYEYTVQNFNKNKNREEQNIIESSDAKGAVVSRQDIGNDQELEPDAPTQIAPVVTGNLTFESDELEYSSQYLYDGEGRAGCECGKLPFKIPVDEKSGLNSSPWMAAIVRGGIFAGGRPHCAATLVNNLYVLTSSSCMDGLFPDSVQVWLTAHDSFEHNQASFGNIKVNVQEILMHPNYNRQSKENDLCLVKLSQPVDISTNSYFVPACLPAGTWNFAGTMAEVTGWSDGRAYKMCRGKMPILDNNVCNRDTRHSGKITTNMVCAGYLTPSRVETCIGDAGGPLISPNAGRSTLVGVVSFGYEAKQNDYSPTVYSRVSEFSDWILHNTRDADWCGI